MHDQVKFLETLCLVLVGLMVLRAYAFWAQGRRAAAITATDPQVPTSIATWVAPSLYGKAMANGQAYSPYNLTTRVPKGLWPLGSQLLIEAGDRKVCVTVTDWCGPFAGFVHLDLSEAAFSRLADTDQGRIIGITVKKL